MKLTASKCLPAFRIAKLIRSGAPNAAVKASRFIKSKVWQMDNIPYQSYWMKYGIESEPNAIKKYERQTKSVVATSGLWVNPKYPFLACSPDGLVGQDGIIEIKSLKIFKFNTIEDITSPSQTSIPEDTISRQCFTVFNGKCQLKHSHDYYYQIQIQLLVTERKFCDFIFYAENGPVSVKRIFREMNSLLMRF